MTMRIAVIGATGMMGTAVVTEALARGYQVTGLCRNATRLPEASGLMPVSLDIFDRGRLAQAVGGHDVVVSCYGSGHVHDPAQNAYRETIEAVIRIIDAATAANARLIFVGGAGSLVDASGVALVDQPGYPESMMPMMNPAFLAWLSTLPAMAYDPSAQRRGGAYVGGPDYVPALVRAKRFFMHDRGFAWSFFSPPPSMVPGARTGMYMLGDSRLPIVGGCYASISTADAAVALVDEIDRADQTWRHWTAYSTAPS